MDLLLEGAYKLGIDLTERQVERFEKYISEIELFNPIYKLVSYTERDELIIKHILDSLSGLSLIKEYNDGTTIADLGSGAGFPGVVLSIMLDNEFCLIERMKRRYDFLNNVILRINSKNVRLVNKDIKDVDELFSTITCRAFHPIFDISNEIKRLLKKDGYACFYKAKRSYVLSEMESVEGFSYEIKRLKVPFLDEERCLAILKREI